MIFLPHVVIFTDPRGPPSLLLQRVLETANGVLHLGFDLVGLAVRLEFGVADRSDRIKSGQAPAASETTQPGSTAICEEEDICRE
jgi:hypothetical protein